jgi:biopolymer transport protein ExbB
MEIERLKDLIDYGVIVTLGVMGFMALWAYIERLIFLSKIDLNSYRYREELDIDLSRNITIISSVGANAPYVGLLGTVLGIIITFYLLGESGNMSAGVIMKSLSLALKATAFGLVVAIPAMIFYNHIVRKIEVTQSRWEIIKRDEAKEV